MPRLICFATVVSLLLVGLAAPEIAAARGRGRSSPYIMTPNGPMLKSQYYAQNLQIADPTMIARMQQREQQMLNKGKKPGNTAGTDGRKSTAGKPNTAKKK